ncbi:hypothetical protein HDV00_009241 [Rhizophlyctis rosea]|nr:hypothetical protein HDV00_009241 [Rhizophlyctis rosea]
MSSLFSRDAKATDPAPELVDTSIEAGSEELPTPSMVRDTTYASTSPASALASQASDAFQSAKHSISSTLSSAQDSLESAKDQAQSTNWTEAAKDKGTEAVDWTAGKLDVDGTQRLTSDQKRAEALTASI